MLDHEECERTADMAFLEALRQSPRHGSERRKGIMSVQPYPCVICGGNGASKHHLVPVESLRRKGINGNATRTVRTCFHCHRDIHFFISHWELAYRFNTEELLRAEFIERKRLAGEPISRCNGRCGNPNCRQSL